MKLAKLMTLALVTVLLFSCRYGVSVDSFPPARTARGVTSDVTTDRGRFVGELIEVRDSGIVILTERSLRLVLYSEIVSSRFEGMNRGVALGNRRPPTAESREQLRMSSRFPPGLTPEMLERLLKAQGQTSLAGGNP